MCKLRTDILCVYFYVLQNFSAPVVNACLTMLGNVKPEGGIILSRVGVKPVC